MTAHLSLPKTIARGGAFANLAMVCVLTAVTNVINHIAVRLQNLIRCFQWHRPAASVAPAWCVATTSTVWKQPRLPGTDTLSTRSRPAPKRRHPREAFLPTGFHPWEVRTALLINSWEKRLSSTRKKIRPVSQSSITESWSRCTSRDPRTNGPSETSYLDGFGASCRTSRPPLST